MLENFCSDIIQTMKCFASQSFILCCQAEHTKINSQLNFNPGLAPLSPFEQPAPGSLDQHSTDWATGSVAEGLCASSVYIIYMCIFLILEFTLF